MIKLKSLLSESLKMPFPINYKQLPVETFKSVGYWVSPKGDVYDVQTSHTDFADKYLFPNLEVSGEARNLAIDSGWIRIRTNSPEHGYMEIEYKFMNPKQKSLIIDFCKRQNLEGVVFKGDEWNLFKETTYGIKQSYPKSHPHRQHTSVGFPPDHIEEKTYLLGKDYPRKSMDYSNG